MKKVYRALMAVVASGILLTGCKINQHLYMNITDTTEYSWREVAAADVAGASEKKKSYTIVGKVVDIKGQDIVVGLKIKNPPAMGEKLMVVIGKKMAKMEVTYPMMTVIKCRLVASDRKYRGDVRKGAAVLR